MVNEKVGIYCRFSPKDKTKIGHTIDTQKRICEDFCKRKTYAKNESRIADIRVMKIISLCLYDVLYIFVITCVIFLFILFLSFPLFSILHFVNEGFLLFLHR